MGSGTIISPDGLILTNWHVIDMAAHRAQLDAWEAQASEDGESLTFVLDEDRVLILGTDGASAPEPVYTAEVVAEDHALDLAVLRITGDEYGAPLSGTDALPFVPLGDSSTVRQGDPIDLFGYPMIGGDTLTYTDGVVSGFDFEEGIDGPAWITTNATMSGGSSGGTALDRAGRLIGVPTQGTELDCRPGRHEPGRDDRCGGCRLHSRWAAPSGNCARSPWHSRILASAGLADGNDRDRRRQPWQWHRLLCHPRPPSIRLPRTLRRPHRTSLPRTIAGPGPSTHPARGSCCLGTRDPSYVPDASVNGTAWLCLVSPFPHLARSLPVPRLRSPGPMSRTGFVTCGRFDTG